MNLYDRLVRSLHCSNLYKMNLKRPSFINQAAPSVNIMYHVLMTMDLKSRRDLKIPGWQELCGCKWYIQTLA